jgi:arginyl-tRNA synthetase
MLLAKSARKPPREVAKILLENMTDPEKVIAKSEMAGPGFLNLWVTPAIWLDALEAITREGKRYGRSMVGGGQRVMVEYVSANPTGPMHVGHGRGAAVGDAIAALLEAAGWHVTREYYVNDAGGQVKQLGKALWMRYREQCGISISAADLPYPGEYLIEVARKLKALHGDKYVDADAATQEGFFTDFAIEEMLQIIRGDLAALNIRFDSWFSERGLHRKKAIDQAVATLTERGHLFHGVLPPPKDAAHAEEYEPREQLLFKATAFGDDQDRPLQKSDGSYTYFAADIAYHKDKLDRGHDWLIDVWGADHGGYIKRVKSAVEALTGRKGALDVVLVQMVNLIKGGQPYRMSKRAGTFVTLRELVEEAGRDATRVMFLMKRADAQLEFDLDLVKRQTLENPVFYVQYGHARCANILKRAAESGFTAPAFDRALLERHLTHPDELDLIKRISTFPDMVESAARSLEPHRVLFWVQETSATFQSYYTRGKREPALRVIRPTERDVTVARLILVQCLKTVFANALALMGVSAPEWMEVPQELE